MKIKYQYQGRSKDGQIQSGIIEASSREEAIAVAQGSGIFISSIEEKDAQPTYTKEITLFQRVSGKDVVIFSRQLAIMFKSKMPIVESLRTIAKQTAKNNFKDQINKIADKVESGSTFSQALETYPKTFNSFYIGMVKSGEISGKLSEALEYLADHLEREYNFNGKVMGAFMYPAFIFFVFVAILILMMIFVIPGLEEIFEGMDLPMMTQLVLNSGNIISSYWWIGVGGFLLIIYSLVRFYKTTAGREKIDKFILKVPFFGDFVKKINLVRISENLSTLISGGLPIVQTMEITSGVVTNQVFKDIILEARNGVRKGELISTSLERYPEYFSVFFIQMVSIGEKTGNIDSSLANVVTFYQGEIDRMLETMVKMMEPVMIILIGGVIGFVVLAVMGPIYQISM